MTLEAHDIREIAVGLFTGTAKERARATGRITDGHVERADPRLVAATARHLEDAILLEDDEDTLESQLDTFTELASNGVVPRDVIARVLASRDWDYPWATILIEDLRDGLPYSAE